MAGPRPASTACFPMAQAAALVLSGRLFLFIGKLRRAISCVRTCLERQSGPMMKCSFWWSEKVACPPAGRVCSRRPPAAGRRSSDSVSVPTELSVTGAARRAPGGPWHPPRASNGCVERPDGSARGGPTNGHRSCLAAGPPPPPLPKMAAAAQCTRAADRLLHAPSGQLACCCCGGGGSGAALDECLTPGPGQQR